MILAYNSGNLIFPDIGFAWYTKNKINHLCKLNQKLKKAKCLKTSKKPYVGAIWGTFCLFLGKSTLNYNFFSYQLFKILVRYYYTKFQKKLNDDLKENWL